MSDPIVMVQAFAELRYGVVVHMYMCENSVKYGHNLGQTLYGERERAAHISTFCKTR